MSQEYILIRIPGNEPIEFFKGTKKECSKYLLEKDAEPAMLNLVTNRATKMRSGWFDLGNGWWVHE